MDKNLWNMICEKSQVDEDRLLNVPKLLTKKLTHWTYAAMKKEFKKSMELFSENGFKDECADLAQKCAVLEVYGKVGSAEKSKASSMTENVMANTVYIIETAGAGNVKAIRKLKNSYEEQAADYRRNPVHSLALSPKERAELDRDIDAALGIIRGSVLPETEEKEDAVPSELKTFNMCYGKEEIEQMRNSPQPADGDKRLRARLSDRAYAMMTEYKRSEKITNFDFLENRYLKPNGLKLTEELREFAEIYDGRVFMWRAPMFFINFPASMSWFKGYSADLGLTWTGTVCGDKYFIPFMSEHIAPYLGPQAGSDGMLYFWEKEYYWNECPYASSVSPEEFFEDQAREKYKDQLLYRRRRELENKYFIPEIRMASR